MKNIIIITFTLALNIPLIASASTFLKTEKVFFETDISKLSSGIDMSIVIKSLSDNGTAQLEVSKLAGEELAEECYKIQPSGVASEYHRKVLELGLLKDGITMKKKLVLMAICKK